MAYDFELDNSQYFTATTPFTVGSASSESCTIAAWIKGETLTGFPTVAQICSNVSNNDRYDIRFNGTSAQALQEGQAASLAGHSTDTWYPMVGVFNLNADRDIYTSVGTANNTGSAATGGNQNELNIGRSNANGGNTGFFDGLIAEVAMWKAELTVAEAEAYMDGVSPLLIQPNTLEFYAPLRSTLFEYKSGAILSASASAPTAVEDHPPVMGVEQMQVFEHTAPAAGGGSSAPNLLLLGVG